MESEEYYLKIKWQNLYKTCSTKMEQDRFLVQSVLMFPKLITCAGKLSEEEEIWIWNDITARFNETRFNNKRMNWFANDLKARYNLLKPLVLAQTNVLDCSPLTQDMLTDIKRLTTLAGSNQAQVLLSSNLSWILKLPEKQRLALEADILELLRNLELREIGEVKSLSYEDFEKLEEDCAKEFEGMCLDNLPTPPQVIDLDNDANGSPKKIKEEDPSLLVPISQNIKGEENLNKSLPTRSTRKVKTKFTPKRKSIATTTTASDTNMPLIKCIPPKFIPIKDAHLYIRNFVVRVPHLKRFRKRTKNGRFSNKLHYH